MFNLLKYKFSSILRSPPSLSRIFVSFAHSLFVHSAFKAHCFSFSRGSTHCRIHISKAENLQRDISFLTNWIYLEILLWRNFKKILSSHFFFILVKKIDFNVLVTQKSTSNEWGCKKDAEEKFPSATWV
jgi:hypothetical protein